MAKILCFFLLAITLENYSTDASYRSDYKYIDALKAAVKVFNFLDFEDSVFRCQWDGTVLFYPRSRQEAEAVTELMLNRSIDRIYVGVHDFFYEEKLMTVDGTDDFYANWLPNQPNLDETRPSVVMHNTTRFEVYNGNSFIHAICADRNASLCPDVDLSNYTVIEEFNAAYRLHEGEEIYRANMICVAEGATVFYPTSDAETVAVFEYVVPRNVSSLQIGIHDYFGFDELRTVDGKTQFHTNWDFGHPSDSRYISVLNNSKYQSRRSEYLVCKKPLTNGCENV